MPVYVALIIGGVLALAATILIHIFILPEKKDHRLPKFWQFLRDLFTLRQLLLERILRFMYVFNTFACILGGFFLLMAGERIYGQFHSAALVGLLIMILGPVVVRLLHETFMLALILCKNTSDINAKMGPAPKTPQMPVQAPMGSQPPMGNPAPMGEHARHAAPMGTPAPQNAYAPRLTVCQNCGTRYDPAQGPCPMCGRR
ncbi:MAG: hypothetical protein IJK28_09480 [Clostridia bacterium]|nr:hypothetical protein [Clostridia bacterium]